MHSSKVYLTRSQSRTVDEKAMAAGISGITLMENAGSGCVNVLIDRKVESAVVCAGSGNNAGDGFVIARLLFDAGVPVKAILCCPPEGLTGDALTNYQRAVRLNVPFVRIDDSWTDERLAAELNTAQDRQADWIVDAMLGTGASGNPRPPMDRVIRLANQTAAKRLAIDIPSGLDCETGTTGDPTFCADLTCTFVTPKIGFKHASARRYLGEVIVIDIGVPDQIVAEIVAAGVSNGTSHAT